MAIPVRQGHNPGTPLPPGLQRKLQQLEAAAAHQARAGGFGQYDPNFPLLPSGVSLPNPGSVTALSHAIGATGTTGVTAPVQPSPRPVPAIGVAHTTRPVKKR